jgi:hypothetical protein
VSPTLISLRPQSFPISLPATDSRRIVAAPSKAPIAVIFPSRGSSERSLRKDTRSRTLIVPEKSRAYATFSPAGPRSTLKTPAERGPSAVGAAGSSSATPVVKASTPAPVSAEPK